MEDNQLAIFKALMMQRDMMIQTKLKGRELFNLVIRAQK
jgi:hypothetical protein